MARIAVGWTVPMLAEKAGLRPSTVSHYELGRESYQSTVEKLRSALEGAGVIFISDGEASIAGGAGVRLKAG